MNAEIERKMIIGLIASTEYYKKIRQTIDPNLIPTPVAKTIALWCNEYFDKYRKAPGSDIASIYFTKAKTGKYSKDVLEEIEEDILPELSDEWTDYGIEIEPLIDDTKAFFKYYKIQKLKDELDILLEKEDLSTAEQQINEYRVTTPIKDELVFNNKEQLRTAVKAAFAEANEPLIYYPGALGDMWNSVMVRGGFVGFLGPEKRGKTALMMDAANRGVRQGRKVAVFQAGDMSTLQQVMRQASYLTKLPTKEKYIGKILVPQKDCYFNQMNDCGNPVRECDFGIFEDRGFDQKGLRQQITAEEIHEAYKLESDYKPCWNCSKYKENNWGAVWCREMEIADVVDEQTALEVMEDYYVTKNRDIRISTHPNDSLTVMEMEQILDTWEEQDGFVADIVILDYADLLASSGGSNEERHKQNNNWKKLRGLNQKKNFLLITATQSDANSYERDLLTLKNFSEDKRKFAHVTAFYGLNQDHTGREKNLGILRINELILREDGFDANRQVTILQAMHIGRPILTSYW